MVTHKPGDTTALEEAAFKTAVIAGCADSPSETTMAIIGIMTAFLRICRTAKSPMSPPFACQQSLARIGMRIRGSPDGIPRSRNFLFSVPVHTENAIGLRLGRPAR